MSRRAEEMSEETRVSLIGLDTSHAVTFSQKMHDPDCPEEQKVKGMKVTACLRFMEDGLYKPAFLPHEMSNLPRVVDGETAVAAAQGYGVACEIVQHG
jgi:hypothetical protein